MPPILDSTQLTISPPSQPPESVHSYTLKARFKYFPSFLTEGEDAASVNWCLKPPLTGLSRCKDGAVATSNTIQGHLCPRLPGIRVCVCVRCASVTQQVVLPGSN